MLTKLKTKVKQAWDRLRASDTARRAVHTFWQAFLVTGLGTVVIDATGVHINLPVGYAAAMSGAAAVLSLLKGAILARWGKSAATPAASEES